MIALLSVLAMAAASPASVAALKPCGQADLTLSTEDEGDGFSGMSHAGTLLVVRNIGPAACRVPSLPVVSMLDAQGAALPVRRQTPVGMHPGPVMLPLALAPQAEATAAILWLSSPVYDHNRCLTPAKITVRLGGANVAAPWPGGQVCGQASAPATFQQPPLHLDAVFTGG